VCLVGRMCFIVMPACADAFSRSSWNKHEYLCSHILLFVVHCFEGPLEMNSYSDTPVGWRLWFRTSGTSYQSRGYGTVWMSLPNCSLIRLATTVQDRPFASFRATTRAVYNLDKLVAGGAIHLSTGHQANSKTEAE
jgi:hypothetical protein